MHAVESPLQPKEIEELVREREELKEEKQRLREEKKREKEKATRNQFLEKLVAPSLFFITILISLVFYLLNTFTK